MKYAKRTSIAMAVLMIGATAVAAHVKPGGEGRTVVTLAEAPLQVGRETLTIVPPGTELAVETVKGEWVWVAVQQGADTHKGYIQNRCLTATPEGEFLKLTVRFEDELDWGVDQEFKRIDDNLDRQLTLAEFLMGTTNETLDDLNRQMIRVLDSVDKTITVPDRDLRTKGKLSWLAWQLCGVKGVKKEITFKSWQRKPTQEEARQIAADLLRTRDIRRSDVAQRLLDREDSETRANRARALFIWADKNRDRKLTRAEFKQALAQKTQSNEQ